MSGSAASPMYPHPGESESSSRLPVELERLLAANTRRVDEEAWAAFVAHYSALLLRVAASFGRGYDETLDRYLFLLEELRRSDYRRLRKFVADGRGRFSTWLAVVARRLCLDHHRQRFGRFRSRAPSDSVRSLDKSARWKLATLSSEEDELGNLPDPVLLDPAEALEDRERRVALRHAVDQLTPGDQLLIRLRFNEGLTARQAAKVLGLRSPFHVYRRLDTIYRTLRLGILMT